MGHLVRCTCVRELREIHVPDPDCPATDTHLNVEIQEFEPT